MNAAFSDDDDRVWSMAAAMCAGEISDDELRALEERLLVDEDARRLYLAYCQLDVALEFELGGQRSGRLASGQIQDEMRATAIDAAVAAMPAGVPIPGVLVDSSSSAIRSPFGYLTSGWPVAYLIATVVFGIGAMIGAFTYVAPHGDIVKTPVPAAAEGQTERPLLAEIAARITGMSNCVWGGSAPGSASVRLGQRVELTSGLLEITYESGAKVVLQGPIDYTVESPNGGHLSVGKLTAKLEKRGEGRGERGEKVVRGQRLSSHRPLTTIHYPLFTITTPTAVITDLGTEFGVDVDEKGGTLSHVFRGSVEVQAISPDGAAVSSPWTLRENDSVQVASAADPIRRVQVDPKRFLRSLSNSSWTKESSSLQVVAWFRLGEDDPRAAAGSPLTAATINRAGRYHLSPSVKPTYSDNVAPVGSSMSVHFGGTDSECVASTQTPYLMTDDFVLEAWAFPRKLKEFKKKGYQFVVYNGDPNANGYGVCIGSGRWMVLFGGVEMIETDVPAELATWTHIALVRERGRMQLWVNGKPAGSPSAKTPETPSPSFSIGCDHSVSPQFAFIGEIDEVRLSKLLVPFRPDMLLFHPSSRSREKRGAGN